MKTAIVEHESRVNSDLLELLPPDAKVVVDVACGTGTLGAEYKRINPAVEYIGITDDPNAAEIAAARLDRVVTASVEEFDEDTFDVASDSVDCLIYDGVLERLLDPWRVLKHQSAWLKEGGQVLACIPNVQHCSLILNLLRGQWDCRDQGLLDPSQLRFFTLDSVKQFFEQVGLFVFGMRSRGVDAAENQRFQKLMAPVISELGLVPAEFAMRTAASQYVIRAVKSQEVPPRLLIQTLLAAPQGCSEVRVREPDRFLYTIPGVRTAATVKTAELQQDQPGEEKVFVWQRAILHTPEDLDRQRQLLRRGYLIVAEFDDHPMRWPQYAESDHLYFRSCHCIQTSTKPLAEFLSQFNPNVAIFPNQLAVLPPRRETSDGPVTVFFGALNREDDWQDIMPILNRVVRSMPKGVRFQVIYDRKFFDALETANKEFTPWCDYKRYLEVLESCDVGLLPLLPTEMNLMKSDLKFLEHAASGTVALASPAVYEHTITDGETGLIYRSPADFEALFADLLANRDRRQTLADNAYEWVAENRLLSRHYRTRYEWYLQMRREMPRLNNELRSRMPQLFE